ncbi:MAG TPA: response regulator transcription factor [Acidimicrobiales bacterium]|nr:response regulator transcription factor [Acidimicrobiales bacterium]
MTDRKARVLVVEDDGPIRSALDVSLRGEGYEVRAESDGTRLAEVAEGFRPDLAVLDVRLPAGPDGYAMGRILRASSDLPVLFLTAADSIDDRLAGFEAGADDYMAKPFSMAELLARVEALLRRAGRLASAVRQVGDVVIDEGARVATRNGERLDLTHTEYELLAMLARHPGQVLSKTQLLTHVWGFEAYGRNVVEVHMSALRKKLEANGARIVHTVRGAGYVLRSP